MILCDHASNFIPPEYQALRLDPAARESHIAWDPGALGVSRALSRRLDAILVYATVSRLVIDCNRPLDASDLIAAVSESTTIPGNAGLSEAQRQRRAATVHAPYHAAVERVIDERLAGARETALIAVHSFTPVYRGVSRPWEVGVIFDRDRSLAEPLMEKLRSEGFNVGANEPYSPADRVYYTLARHGEARGLAQVMIEIRNDLIVNDDEQRAWGDRLARLLSGFAVGAEAA